MSSVHFNESYFDSLLQSAEVEALCMSKAQQALKVAQATAPVDTGAYRDGLKIEVRKSAHRKSFRVVGTDKKTILVECKTGNLVRALRAVR